MRFQITCGHQKKFLSLESAGLELKPVLEQATEWGPLKLQASLGWTACPALQPNAVALCSAFKAPLL